jgi:drug/metabolite transporter (DMT)-like permease
LSITFTHKIKTLGYTTAALIAFAANSVLCRMALSDDAIDPASFTVLRLLSGSAIFVVIFAFKSHNSTLISTSRDGSWLSPLMLFLYALTFSFAYVSLDTGTGALVLFGAVQLTMIISSVINGNRLHISEWLGMSMAFIGLVYLVYPTVTTPSISGFILMVISGVAWGIYSLIGRSSKHPLRDTACNFKRTIPLIAILALATMPTMTLSSDGIILAVISGALASGVGYSIWYVALSGLSVTEAAVVQLSVPVIAAVGGLLFVFEPITARLIYSAILMLGGILIVVLGRYYFVISREKTDHN